jgi:uncharacterized protein (TIGR02266 family)
VGFPRAGSFLIYRATMNPQPQALPNSSASPAATVRPRFRGRRVTFMYPLQIQVVDRPGVTLRAHATNLSMGGMFIYALQPLPVGTQVRIALDVKGRPLLLAEAEVRWVRGSAFKSYPWCPGFGVRFTRLSSPKAVDLVRYLVTRANQRRGPEVAEAPAPEPEPLLPKITPLDAPLDEKDHNTKQMYPLSPEPYLPPISAIAPAKEPRPLSALEQQGRTSGGTWRWLRWGLAVAAVGGWLAAFTHVQTAGAVRAAAARVLHPSGEQR